MSHVFVGVVVPVAPPSLPASFHQHSIGNGAVVLYEEGVEESPAAEGLARELSRGSKALHLQWDPRRVGLRSATLFVDGAPSASFGPDDELWLAVNIDGPADFTAKPVRGSERLEGQNYDLHLNAVQKGLKELGCGWYSALREVMMGDDHP